jgi:hypothetical protein
MQKFDQVVPSNETQEYQLNYSPEPGSQIEVTQKVQIDVVPWSDKNFIFPKAGIIPVAILNTSDFDLANVDIPTIRLGNGEAKPLIKKGFYIDVDHDRDKDLLLFFRAKDTGVQNSDTQICLKGTTKKQIPFEGCDSIKVIVPPAPPNPPVPPELPAPPEIQKLLNQFKDF